TLVAPLEAVDLAAGRPDEEGRAVGREGRARRGLEAGALGEVEGVDRPAALEVPEDGERRLLPGREREPPVRGEGGPVDRLVAGGERVARVDRAEERPR